MKQRAYSLDSATIFGASPKLGVRIFVTVDPPMEDQIPARGMRLNVNCVANMFTLGDVVSNIAALKPVRASPAPSDLQALAGVFKRRDRTEKVLLV